MARSRPLFPGHRQPELPGELGFYDLRVPQTRYTQARLAREHGITGFLYYHYWFSGQRMLSRPFDEVLESGQPDFPFALCWANESWYRRWQGSVDEMLVEQTFSEEDDIAHIRWMIECFKDPRYIRIQGRPLVAVYRAQHLPDPTRTVELWHAECDRAEMEHPWLVMFETAGDIIDPKTLGFDASAEFVPHLIDEFAKRAEPSPGFNGSHRLYEYEEVATGYLKRPEAEWPRYPCVATAWDNSPRRQNGEALILRNSTPEAYGRWLAGATKKQMETAEGNGIVFINAWNEWAEGAHLEPDDFWGRAYLEVTRTVLSELCGDVTTELGVPSGGHGVSTPIEDLYHDLYEQFVALEQRHSGYVSYEERRRTDLRRLYEAQLRKEGEAANAVGDLNQLMAEQIKYLVARMNDLGVSDVDVPSWAIVP